MYYVIFRLLFKIFFKVACRLKICGVQNIPKEGPFIIASNHASYLDPILLGVSCNRIKLYYMARHTLFESPFLNWAFKKVHVFPVRRNGMDLKAFKKAMSVLKKGFGLVIFPEGTRSFDGSLKKPEPGAGFLVLKSGVPIIPAYVNGSYAVLPRGAKRFKFGKLSVNFGEPLLFEKLDTASKNDYFNIAGKIMEEIGLLK